MWRWRLKKRCIIVAVRTERSCRGSGSLCTCDGGDDNDGDDDERITGNCLMLRTKQHQSNEESLT